MPCGEKLFTNNTIQRHKQKVNKLSKVKACLTNDCFKNPTSKQNLKKEKG